MVLPRRVAATHRAWLLATLVVATSTGCTRSGDRDAATDTPGEAAGGSLRLELSARPENGEAPLSVTFEARLVGEVADPATFGCPTLAWTLDARDEGQVVIAQPEGCAPGVMPNVYTLEHTYTGARTYEASVRFIARDVPSSNVVQIVVRGATPTPAPRVAMPGPTIVIATPAGTLVAAAEFTAFAPSTVTSPEGATGAATLVGAGTPESGAGTAPSTRVAGAGVLQPTPVAGTGAPPPTPVAGTTAVAALPVGATATSRPVATSAAALTGPPPATSLATLIAARPTGMLVPPTPAGAVVGATAVGVRPTTAGVVGGTPAAGIDGSPEPGIGASPEPGIGTVRAPGVGTVAAPGFVPTSAAGPPSPEARAGVTAAPVRPAPAAPVRPVTTAPAAPLATAPGTLPGTVPVLPLTAAPGLPSAPPTPAETAAIRPPARAATRAAPGPARRVLPADLYYLDEGGRLMRIPATGEEPSEVTGLAVSVDRYALAPTGHVAFTSGGALFTLSPGAGGPARLADGGARAPVWARNGRRVAYATPGGVFAYDFGGRRHIRLADDGTPLAWSREGDWLALGTVSGRLGLVEWATLARTDFPYTGVREAGWLPDRDVLWVAGDGLRLLTVGGDAWIQAQLLPPAVRASTAFVRPDGTLLAVADTGQEPQVHAADLASPDISVYVAGPPLDLAAPQDLAWAPDGRHLARAGPGGLDLVDAFTAAEVPLLARPVEQPGWVLVP